MYRYALVTPYLCFANSGRVFFHLGSVALARHEDYQSAYCEAVAAHLRCWSSRDGRLPPHAASTSLTHEMDDLDRSPHDSLRSKIRSQLGLGWGLDQAHSVDMAAHTRALDTTRLASVAPTLPLVRLDKLQ